MTNLTADLAVRGSHTPCAKEPGEFVGWSLSLDTLQELRLLNPKHEQLDVHQIQALPAAVCHRPFADGHNAAISNCLLALLETPQPPPTGARVRAIAQLLMRLDGLALRSALRTASASY